MADVLSIGTSALLSLQRAISVTGHNIANVNTEGYSRQSVNFATLEPTFSPVGFEGNGVQISSITRGYNAFLAEDVRSRNASASAAQTFADLTGRIDGVLANENTGLAPALDQFFSALQDVANNPGGTPERQVLLSSAEVLADRFQYLDSQLRGLQRESNSRIENAVSEINAIASNISALNEQISELQTSGAPANDLLDERDLLIDRLSELIGVSSIERGDGSVNIFVGSGQPLVVGAEAVALNTFPDPNDISRINVSVDGSSATDISSFLSGGELGGVLNFRDQVLGASQNELGLIAVGLSEAFNDQQRLGQDLNGNLGTNFFTTLNPIASAEVTNTGTGTISAVVDDVANLTGDDYTLSFDGASYTLSNNRTGASQTGAGPNFSVDGLTVTAGGAPAAGDSFFISPVSQAASFFDVAISDPRLFAAASPLRSDTSLANAGSGGLSELSATDVPGLPLAGPISLTFNPDALGAGVPGYDVAGFAGGPIPYDPSTDSAGIEVTLGDFSFTLDGVPQDGDSFTISNNVDGSGDNRNALALAGLQERGILLGGTSSLQDVYGTLVADIAVRGGQAQTAAQSETVLLQQSIASRDSVNGVNLDEEAANLLRYQQAYQAAAQVIRVADEVFQVLLNATSR